MDKLDGFIYIQGVWSKCANGRHAEGRQGMSWLTMIDAPMITIIANQDMPCLPFA